MPKLRMFWRATTRSTWILGQVTLAAPTQKLDFTCRNIRFRETSMTLLTITHTHACSSNAITQAHGGFYSRRNVTADSPAVNRGAVITALACGTAAKWVGNLTNDRTCRSSTNHPNATARTTEQGLELAYGEARQAEFTLITGTRVPLRSETGFYKHYGVKRALPHREPSARYRIKLSPSSLVPIETRMCSGEKICAPGPDYWRL